MTDTEKAIRQFELLRKLGYAGSELPSHDVLLKAENALRTQQERENPQPLTLEQLRERVGKPVWIDIIGYMGNMTSEWGLVNGCMKSIETSSGYALYYDDDDGDDYGKTWLAYDHEPKEARDESK
jgi:hypothetical protein